MCWFYCNSNFASNYYFCFQYRTVYLGGILPCTRYTTLPLRWHLFNFLFFFVWFTVISRYAYWFNLKHSKDCNNHILLLSKLYTTGNLLILKNIDIFSLIFHSHWILCIFFFIFYWIHWIYLPLRGIQTVTQKHLIGFHPHLTSFSKDLILKTLQHSSEERVKCSVHFSTSCDDATECHQYKNEKHLS